MITRDCDNCLFCGQRYVGHADPGDEFKCLVPGYRAGPCANYQPNRYMKEIEDLQAKVEELREKLRGRQKKLLVKVIP